MEKKKNLSFCTDCNKIFNTPWSLKRHERRFHREITCSDCEEVLDSKVALKTHKLQKHRTYLCSECPEKTFPRKSSLNRHIQIVHEGDFPVDTVCRLCHTAFDSEENLTAHLDSIHKQNEEFVLYNHV